MKHCQYQTKTKTKSSRFTPALKSLGAAALTLGIAPLGAGCGAQAPVEKEEVSTAWAPINGPQCLTANVDGTVTLNDGISLSGLSLTTPATYNNPRCYKAFVFGLQGATFAPPALMLPATLRGASVKFEWPSVPKNITRQQCEAMGMGVDVMTVDSSGAWQMTQVINFPAHWSAVGCAVEGVELNGQGFRALMDRFDANGTHLWSEDGQEAFRGYDAGDLSDRSVRFAVSARLWTDETVPVKITGTRTFNPADHGFNFANKFENVLLGGFLGFGTVNTKGLCGGMVYAALDYYLHRQAIPVQDFAPVTDTANTSLREYIIERETKSITSTDNATKWAQLYIGDQDDNFWRGFKRNENVRQFKEKLDVGQPVVIDLRSAKDDTGHQVLALNYRLGDYDRSADSYKNLELDVYDPNHPNELTTITRDKSGDDCLAQGKLESECPQPRALIDKARPDRRYRSYFVDREYEPRTPLTIPAPGNGLVLTFHTGADNLDGGDVVNIDLTLKNGTQANFQNVNHSQLWPDGSQESVFLPVSNPDDVAQVIVRYQPAKPASLMPSHKWDLDSLEIANVVNNVTVSPARTTVAYHRYNQDDPARHCTVSLVSPTTTSCPEDQH